MDYTYNAEYGRSDHIGRKRLKDKFGDDILWQHDYDILVHKGLIQVMKEDKIPFKRLLTILQAETVKAMHAGDRWRLPVWQILDKYQGPAYSCAQGTPLAEALRYYWYDHLGVERSRND